MNTVTLYEQRNVFYIRVFYFRRVASTNTPVHLEIDIGKLQNFGSIIAESAKIFVIVVAQCRYCLRNARKCRTHFTTNGEGGTFLTPKV